MTIPNIVVDTNVLIAGLRSKRGWAHRLLLLIGDGKFDISLSGPLLLEYEEVCKRDAAQLSLTAEEIDDILDYLCRIAKLATVYFQWRPKLVDPCDDMVLELAVAGGSSVIVTFNSRHFVGVEEFGIRVCTPKEFLDTLGIGP